MCSSSAPDMSGQNAAALQQAQLSKEQLDWAKQVYAETAPDRAAAAKRATEVSDAQLASMKLNDGISKDYWDYQTKTFRPLEQGIVDAADKYDTTARREAAATEAQADVQSSFDNVAGQTQRSLDRRGVNPSSGAALSSKNQIDMQKAITLAGASNKARKDVELQGYARKMDAANLGRGLSSAQATSAGVALNAGNASAGNAASVGNITAQGNQIVNSGYSGAQAGLSGAASTYGNIASLQAGSNNNAALGALGGVAGQFAGSTAGSKLIAGWMSDKNKKTNRKPVKTEIALAAARKMPVESWQYKKGAADGGKHIGPMAQSVQKAAGDKVAPGGKMIDPISMNGITLAAIQQLDKNVRTLEKKVISLADSQPKRSK